MGQKVNPVGMRIGVNKEWNSRWYADDKNFAKYLNEDIKIRKYLLEELHKRENPPKERKVKVAEAPAPETKTETAAKPVENKKPVKGERGNRENDPSISHIEIERTKIDTGSKITIIVATSRPGIVVGQNGKGIEALLVGLRKIVAKGDKITLTTVEVKQPDLDATLLAEFIAKKLEARASFRTVQKLAIKKAREAGAKGIRTIVSGRLGGADIARSEGYKEGIIPLHTLRSDIDYAVAEAHTQYGRLGVKVWICRGEVRPTVKGEKGE